MGTFFTNVHVRADSVRAVDKCLKHIIKGEAFRSSPAGGWISVYDETCEGQDISELARLARALSSELHTATVAFLVHDNDVSIYLLYDGGQLVEQFVSRAGERLPIDSPPTVDAGAAIKIIRYAVAGTTSEQVEEVLTHSSAEERKKPYFFEEDRVAAIAALLGIRPDRANRGFDRIVRESEEGALADSMRRVTADKVKSLMPPLMRGDVAKVGQFLTGGADPNEPRILEVAIFSGQSPIVHLLLDRGADLRNVANAFPSAAMFCEVGVLKRIMLATDISPAELNAALISATGYGQVDTLKFLLSEGADVNSANVDGITPLMCAASWRHMSATRFLLEAGANAGARSQAGRTALEYVRLNDVFSTGTCGCGGDGANLPSILDMLHAAMMHDPGA